MYRPGKSGGDPESNPDTKPVVWEATGRRGGTCGKPKANDTKTKPGKGADDMQAANNVTDAGAAGLGGFVHAAQLDTQKRIGSTVYEIEVYVKNDAAETIEEKIMRLVRNDLNPTPSHAMIDMPQTSRLPERGSA